MRVVTSRGDWLGRSVAATLTAAVLMIVAGCGTLGGSKGRDKGGSDRWVRPDTPKSSPSGKFVARLDRGPEQDGVTTYVVVITASTGAEDFRDNYAYSSRHGVGVTWLSTADQLWVLSADVGDSHIDRGPDGAWTKTPVYPETVKGVPPEIAGLK